MIRCRCRCRCRCRQGYGPAGRIHGSRIRWSKPIADGIIAAARTRGCQPGTLLSTLLDAHDDPGTLSARDLRDEVFTLFLAGHETTALTMIWFFALIEQNPD